MSASGSEGIRPFGDYLLLGEIAVGGMGIVYRARQISLNRPVALKVIRGAAFYGAAVLQRFRTEAEAVANLEHPNIVPIYEIGEHDGCHYFSMRLLEGGNLGDLVKDRRYEIERSNRREVQGRIATLLSKIARAVHHAHQRGILHRDLKPSNILLDEHGEPYLSDFGIAKFLESDHNQTQTDAVLGTPGYMSPEQAAGKNRLVTIASDTYGLGAVLYHLLTHKPPFEGESVVEILEGIQLRDPIRPRGINAEVDPDLETICLKCLEKEPVRRYASAEGLAEDLERWLRSEPIRARRVPTWERVFKWVKRHPRTTALGGGVLASLILGAVGITWQWQRAEKERGMTHETDIRRRLQKVEELFAKDDGLGAVASLGRLLREQPANRVVTERLLNTLSERVFLLPLANVATITRPPERVRSSRDGTAKVIGIGTTTLHFSNAEGVTWTISNAHSRVIRDLRFSPDGERIVSASADSQVTIWNAQTGSNDRQFKHDAPVYHAEFSPDGRWVATASRDGTARVWNANTGLQIISINVSVNHPSSVSRACFSPDGTKLLTVCDDGSLRIWNAENGKAVSEPLRFQGRIDDASFLSEGRIAAFRAEQSRAFQLSAGLQLWKAHDLSLLENAVNSAPIRIEPSGQKLVASETTLAVSNDRKLHVITSGNSARIWDAQTLIPTRAELLHHDAAVSSADFSQDRLRVATSAANRTVRVWDVATGQPLTDWIHSPEPVARVAFSADGHWIVASSGWKMRLQIAAAPVPNWLPDLAQSMTDKVSFERASLASFFSIRERLLRSVNEDFITVWAKEFVR